MIKNNFSIRQYVPSDLPIVLDLHRKAMEELGVYIEGSVNDDLNDISQNYINKSGTFLIGMIDDAIVSIGALRKIDNNIAEIKRMRTYPNYQGRGYGTEILHALIKRAKLLGYKQLILDTSDKQIAAIKMYTKNGFKEYKREIRHGFNCILFRLDL
jgi:GNAT superfamily N-acetyltransferase